MKTWKPGSQGLRALTIFRRDADIQRRPGAKGQRDTLTAPFPFPGPSPFPQPCSAGAIPGSGSRTAHAPGARWVCGAGAAGRQAEGSPRGCGGRPAQLSAPSCQGAWKPHVRGTGNVLFFYRKTHIYVCVSSSSVLSDWRALFGQINISAWSADTPKVVLGISSFASGHRLPV